MITTRQRAPYFAFPRMPGAIPELDGLRAIAVLLVIARHAVYPLDGTGQPLFSIGSWDVAVPFLNGWIGVDLFFVLSGFLITHHILRRDGTRPLARFGHYLSARALRIVPTYVVVLALAVTGSIPLFQIAQEDLAWRVGYHLLFLQDYLAPDIVVPFWSLGVEEKFYLVAPFLVLAAFRMGSTGRRYVFLAGLILLPVIFRTLTAIQHPDVTEYYWFFRTFRSPFHVSFDGLAVGVCCAFLYRGRNERGNGSRPGWSTWLFWVSTAMLLWQLFAGDLLGEIGWYQKTLQPLVLSLTFGGLLLSVACGGARGSLLRCRTFLIVARVSYPLYLIHITFVPFILEWSGFTAGASLADFLHYFAVFLIVSFIAAFMIHFAVEKPFLLLKDYLGKSPTKLPAAEPVGQRAAG